MATIKYRDIDLKWTQNPITGDVNSLTDEVAVTNSLKNLVLTSFYEIPFEKSGGNVRRMLFENVTVITAITLRKEIEDVINNYEPRVKLESVNVDVYQEDSYSVSVVFYMVSKSNPLTLNFILEKLR